MGAVLESDGGKIKPSRYNQGFTADQVLELNRCRTDCIYFIEKYVKIQHPKLGAIPFLLFDFQKKLIQVYMDEARVIAMLSRQCGKALSLDTPIPTPAGWTTMGDIKVGDWIFGDDGKPTQVSFTTDIMYNHDVYEVEFDNGEIIKADAEHIWRFSSNAHKNGQIVESTTSEIIPILKKTKSFGQNVRINISEPLELSNVDLPIHPYTLGIWLGNGYNNDGRFTSEVDDTNEICNKIINDGYDVSKSEHDKQHVNTIYGIRPILRDMGILNDKKIPEKYLRASIEQRLELLRGLMDGVGNISPRGVCEFYQKNSNLAWSVFELVASLGIKPRMRTKKVSNQHYHTVVFNTTRFSVFNLSRKKELQEKNLEHPKNTHIFFNDIRKIESVPVRCIQVNNKSHMFLCGKSMIPTHNTTTAAAYLLWCGIFKDDQSILIASKDQGGADEIMERLWFAYEELPWFLKPGVKKNDIRTKHFDNGSKIKSTATTKTSGRGKSNSVIYLDEFAFVPPNIAGEFWTAIYPTLSTGGDCIITSTPNTDEDKFATIWFNAAMSPNSDKWQDKLNDRNVITALSDEEEYETIFENNDVEKDYKFKIGYSDNDDEKDDARFVGFHAHWTSVPEKYKKNGKIESYRGDKFKRETLSAGLTNEDWLREYECCFISGDSTLISGQKLATLRHTVHDPRFVDKWGCRWYEEIQPNVAYAATLDPSEGVGLDAACIQIWELPRMKQVAEWADNQADQIQQVRVLKNVLRRIRVTQNSYQEHNGDNNIYFSVERNGQGIGIIRIIENEGEDSFDGWFVDATQTSISAKGEGIGVNGISRWRGLHTSASSKRRYAYEFKSLVERNLFVVRSSFLASEMKTFIRKGQQLKAKEGTKDDIIMSCILMCHLIDELRYQEPDLDDMIYPDLLEDVDIDDDSHPDNMALLPII